jgi:hypothetical protein
VRVVTTSRDQRFYLCERSSVDERFPKYPRLPVIACPGFEAVDPDDGRSTIR